MKSVQSSRSDNAELVTEIMPLAQERRVQLQAVLPIDARELYCDQEEIRRVVQKPH